MAKSVSRLIPVNSIPVDSSRKGVLKKADIGILIMATVKMASNAFEALEKVAEPNRQRPVQIIRAAVWNPYPLQYP